MKPVIISYFTNDEYHEEAKKLIKSIEEHAPDFAMDIRRAPDFGDWRLNTAQKAQFITAMLNAYQKPVLFVDADAEFYARPVIFEQLAEDVEMAYHLRHGDELLTGTIYMAPTEKIYDVLARWNTKSMGNINVWEQKHLEAVLREGIPPKTVILPVEYCSVFDGDDRPDSPIIVHNQASRRLKKLKD